MALIEEPDVRMERGQAACQGIARLAQLLQGGGPSKPERHPRSLNVKLRRREFCRRSKLPQSERSWNLFAAERYRRGETGIPLL